jgi:hypothetical protein
MCKLNVRMRFGVEMDWASVMQHSARVFSKKNVGCTVLCHS